MAISYILKHKDDELVVTGEVLPRVDDIIEIVLCRTGGEVEKYKVIYVVHHFHTCNDIRVTTPKIPVVRLTRLERS